MKKVVKKTGLILFITTLLISSCVTNSSEDKIEHDPHYTTSGFFDLHVCNWPDQPLFFLAVFSSFNYEEIKSVTIYRPDGSKLGAFNLENFRAKKLKNNKTKHIYIDKFPANTNDKDGWYKAVIQLASGESIIARDYIKIKKMPVAKVITPGNSLKSIQIPEVLSWQGISEAKYYKVTIRDMWEGEKLIHSSPLFQQSEYHLPKGLIKPGGWYTWRVHARDINEDLLLGDFNHGSLTLPAVFLTTE